MLLEIKNPVRGVRGGVGGVRGWGRGGPNNVYTDE
jgi:hypothetical protein